MAAPRRDGCGANHRNSGTRRRLHAQPANAMHNHPVLSKMPANEQKARPTGTDKDPKFTPQELEAASGLASNRHLTTSLDEDV